MIEVVSMIAAMLLGAYVGVWIIAMVCLAWSKVAKDEWDREFMSGMFQSFRTVLTFGAIK